MLAQVHACMRERTRANTFTHAPAHARTHTHTCMHSARSHNLRMRPGAHTRMYWHTHVHTCANKRVISVQYAADTHPACCCDRCDGIGVFHFKALSLVLHLFTHAHTGIPAFMLAPPACLPQPAPPYPRGPAPAPAPLP